MAQKGDAPFPYIMTSACIIAVGWQFSLAWLGVLVVLVWLLIVRLINKETS